mgnify:FL=1
MDNYNNCGGNIVGTCHGYNWTRCPDGFDNSNIVYACGNNLVSYTYDKNTNSCQKLSGNSGKYKTWDECENKEVKRYNFLKNWTCTDVGTAMTPIQYENPMYVTLNDCRTDSQNICKGLTSTDPKKREHSINMLLTASGRELPLSPNPYIARNGQIDCSCAIPY